MAAPATLSALLTSLTQSLSLTQEAVPSIADIEHPKDGISLLDVKNELLLSYLQNLVFLILLKIRNHKSNNTDSQILDDEVRSKLVELRLYLEKGARPLEEKLRFSIERFLRTAADAQRAADQGTKAKSKNDIPGSESEEGISDEESDEGNDKSYRLQPRRGKRVAGPNLSNLIDDETVTQHKHEVHSSGIYIPPRQNRVLMETGRPKERNERKSHKSFVMEEFVNDELSAAPIAEPSIGTTIVQGGRKMKTTEERKDEAERRDYEETNFVRLPKESKKDKAKKNKASGRNDRMQFGGEEWHNLGEGIDRIDRLTKRKGPAGGNVRALLEKSRKRGFDTTDGPRASGHDLGMGDRFQKKAKMLEAGRRDRGKNR
ncbi:hypothetical protein E4U17_006890 [Claviceps sp. LM77 group G4]|nr:hypothetical protein E4U17_006890 [Claviceps sp. LM77 group G4]KAG6084599.1 hypothetical protein E4U33_003124 [Claviceps sp. LM78 group G4]KAG6085579.1 hypothetical protein E4U16_004470 [Claviceps sp. LM84 group G4]